MAVSFVAAGTAATGSQDDLTPALPTGHALNDVLILVAVQWGTTTPGMVTGGWTSFASGIADSTTDNVAFNVLYKMDGGSETAPTVDFTADLNFTTIAQIAAFRGVDTGDPIGEVGTVFTDTSTASATIGPITAVTPGRVDGAVVVFGAKGNNWADSVNLLTGDSLTWVEIGEPDPSGGNNAGAVWDYALFGSIPTLTSKTFTTISATSDARGGVMFVVQAPGAAAAGPPSLVMAPYREPRG